MQNDSINVPNPKFYLTDCTAEDRLMIGQQPPFNYQLMGEIEFWLACSQRIT
jgi:hypothetical protein